MKNKKYDIERMTVAQIEDEIGILLMPEDVFFILDEEYQEEYIRLYDQKITPERLLEYVIQTGENIDKEKMLLLSLKNHINLKPQVFKENGNSIIYDRKIEILKKILEDKKVYVYDYTIDPKTHKVNSIQKITSEFLCANNDLTMHSTEEDFENQKKREERYQISQNKIDKKEKSSLERLKLLDTGIGIKNIIHPLQLDDVDVFVEEKEVAELLRWSTIKNSLIDKGMDYKEIDRIDAENQMDDLIRKEDKRTFIKEYENNLKKYCGYVNIDKMLLMSAFRFTELLENEVLSTENIVNIYDYLKTIVNEIQNPKAKIDMTMQYEDTGDIENVRFSVKELKEKLKLFIEPDVYLGQKLKTTTKEQLLAHGKKLTDVDPRILSELTFNQEEFVKLVDGEKDNFLYAIDESNLDEAHIKVLLDEIKTVHLEVIQKLIEKEILKLDDINELLKKQKISAENTISLVEEKFINDKELIEIYKAQDEKDLILQPENLLSYFNIDKLKEYIQDKKVDAEFLEFYNGILPEDADKRQEILNQIKELLIDCEDKEILKKFYSINILETEDIKDKFAENDILLMYEDKKLSLDQLLENYNNETVTDLGMNLLIEEYDLSKELILKLEENKISLEKFCSLELDLQEDYIFNGYNNENGFKTPNVGIYGIAKGMVSLEQLDKLYRLGKIKEEDLFEAAQKGFFDQKTVRDIYINSLISDEKLEQLCLEGIISEKSKEFAKKSRNMGQIAKNIDKSLGMHIKDDGIEIDYTIVLPPKKIVDDVERQINIYGESGRKNYELKKVTDPIVREKKIVKILGAKKIKRDCVQYDEKSPFNDYEFYILPDENGDINPNCVVIAERYYEDKFSDESKLVDKNATYLFKLSDLTRVSKKPKSEIISLMQNGEDKSVKRVLHSKYWAKNLDSAISMLLGKDIKSRYTEEELHDIDVINEWIDGFEDPANNNEYSRPFDVYFE